MMSFVRRVLVVAALVFVGVVLAAGLLARGDPDLLPWHTEVLLDEVRAGEAPAADWADYLEREKLLFAELDGLVRRAAQRDCASFDRYCPGALSDPAAFERNWNRSVALEPPVRPVGAAVLLHGLMGSPYTMLAAGRTLAAAGYRVLIPRLPGHGTIPSELERTVRADWRHAVRLAVLEAADSTPGELLVAGYSNGGSLALEYALDAAADPELPRATRLVLFAPALELDPLAAFTWWPRAIRWLDSFQKSRWISTQLEVSPFRYYSLSYQSVEQCYALGRRIRARLPSEAASLPPVLTFHSAVDSTVALRPIREDLYARLAGKGHELILLGVNQSLESTGLVSAAPRRDAEVGMAGLTLWEEPRSGWPPRVHSVSHVGVMIPPDDPLNGRIDFPADVPTDRYHFEALRVWSESELQQMNAMEMTRPRYNPFWPELAQRLTQFARQ